LVPLFNGPIYKGILPYNRSLLPIPRFCKMTVYVIGIFVFDRIALEELI
jgi:hypothetical protein